MSDSSSLSSALSDIDEPPAMAPAPVQKTLKLKGGKLTFAAAASAAPKVVSRKSTPEPPSPVREPSPPHDYVLADNPDIAFLVMFRHRFADAFPKTVPNLGPQDIEYGVVESPPSEPVEQYLCALLGLVLNRQKPVERGHHNRALEEALSSHKTQWPTKWSGANPLPGKRSFPDMTPEEKIDLLKALCLWSMNSSETIKAIIAASYKQSRKEDDINQPLSVQPWGTDGRKRRYWLIEGQNDTSFRIYRQSPSKLVRETWWSVAGSLVELEAFANKLRTEDGTQAARRLADKMESAIPRLLQTDEKRKRKEYRQKRRAFFKRPEPGFSMYEGRTRGKRMRYTFSDDEDNDGSDDTSAKRSTRQSGRSSPADVSGPTMTSSGRQIRSKFGQSYGNLIQTTTSNDSGRRTRGRENGSTRSTRGQAFDDESEEEDDEDEDVPSGDDWQGEEDLNDAEDEDDEDEDEDEDIAMADSDLEHGGKRRSLVVVIKYRSPSSVKTATGVQQAAETKRTDQIHNLEDDNRPAVSPQPASFTARTSPSLASPFKPKAAIETPNSKSVSARKSSTASSNNENRPGSAMIAEDQKRSFAPDPYGAWPLQTTPSQFAPAASSLNGQQVLNSTYGLPPIVRTGTPQDVYPEEKRFQQGPIPIPMYQAPSAAPANGPGYGS